LRREVDDPSWASALASRDTSSRGEDAAAGAGAVSELEWALHCFSPNTTHFEQPSIAHRREGIALKRRHTPAMERGGLQLEEFFFGGLREGGRTYAHPRIALWCFARYTEQ
jgi:hypothetical protein